MLNEYVNFFISLFSQKFHMEILLRKVSRIQIYSWDFSCYFFTYDIFHEIPKKERRKTLKEFAKYGNLTPSEKHPPYMFWNRHNQQPYPEISHGSYTVLVCYFPILFYNVSYSFIIIMKDLLKCHLQFCKIAL